ncbi:uncharacterized protein PFLUO_LOCUS6450 [Penicillium psychrofluorescens]|uniref:uncharacterized protein n=1 Tax=Penicillium psychrofluorescens TaxID=3158075 RepID=UPI003CCCAC43
MPKGKKKKAKKAQKDARDMQTPASDRASDRGSDSEPPNVGSSAQQDVEKAHSRLNKFTRSPTRKEDFAPGELNDDHESNDNTDTELEDASEQDVPVEDKPDPVGRWVKDIIQDEAKKRSERMVEEFFTAVEPQYEECIQFFQRLNQQIRAANDAHGINDIDNGIIPERFYVDLCQTWRQQHTNAKENNSQEGAWEAFHKTHDLIKLFNKRHRLPKSWNISSVWAQQDIGSPDPRADADSDTTNLSNSDSDEPKHLSELSTNEESSAEYELDKNATSIDLS